MKIVTKEHEGKCYAVITELMLERKALFDTIKTLVESFDDELWTDKQRKLLENIREYDSMIQQDLLRLTMAI